MYDIISLRQLVFFDLHSSTVARAPNVQNKLLGLFRLNTNTTINDFIAESSHLKRQQFHYQNIVIRTNCKRDSVFGNNFTRQTFLESTENHSLGLIDLCLFVLGHPKINLRMILLLDVIRIKNPLKKQIKTNCSPMAIARRSNNTSSTEVDATTRFIFNRNYCTSQTCLNSKALTINSSMQSRANKQKKNLKTVLYTALLGTADVIVSQFRLMIFSFIPCEITTHVR